MKVENCDELSNIFVLSTTKCLPNLQRIAVINCNKMKEIFAIGGEEADVVDNNNTIEKIEFAQIRYLSLGNLLELKSFCREVKGPSMSPNQQETQEGLTASTGYDRIIVEDMPDIWTSLFNEKIFPNLEELGLSVKDIMMLLQGDFSQDHLFGSLKDMEVRDDDSAILPIGLLGKFHRLENLNLSYCSYKELFSNGGQVHLIKKLELICLDDLEYLWIPRSNMGDSIFQNLEILKVDSCQKLMNLVTPVVAKSLVQLVSLTIYGCSAMTQVVISEGDAAAAKEEIVFIKLKSLDLHHLDSLTCFSSSNYTFRFPSLEYLCMIGCPKMKIFTAGDLRTLTESVCYGYGHCEWRSVERSRK